MWREEVTHVEDKSETNNFLLMRREGRLMMRLKSQTLSPLGIY